jgi:hypothetical protein
VSIPKIDHYRFGNITINGHKYAHDVIILPDRVLPNWWRNEGHELAMEDLQQVLNSDPELLVIGQGAYSRMRVPSEVQEQLQAEGIEFSITSTNEACEIYNRERQNRRTVAALHLTC